jgi:hypothetical protein
MKASPLAAPMLVLCVFATAHLALAAPATVYTNDFEGAVGSQWMPGTVTVTPNGQRHFLGRFGSELVTLLLNNLPAHSLVTVTFDLFVIQSWDGNSTTFGPDVWEFGVIGERTLLRTTFSNSGDSVLRQAFPEPYLFGSFAGATGAFERNKLGYPPVPNYSGGTDSIYKMSFSFAHADGRLALKFGAGGLETLSNESWGLDNVSVSVSEPASGIFEMAAPVVYTTESSANAIVRVNRLGATNAAATVQFATQPGTATAGTDYIDQTGMLAFAPGESSKTISVPLINDEARENDETFKIALSNPSAGAVLGWPAGAWVNIADDERGDTPFARVESGPLASEGGDVLGAAWGDFDGDGFEDVFVPNANGRRNALYRNNGDGTFTKVVSGIVVAEGGRATAAAWGDYDNDGDLDLFVANFGNNFLYRNNGDGTFAKITTGPVVTDNANSNACAWGDYDNDGWLDLFVANDPANNALYHNNGNGTFAKVTTGSIVLDGGASTGCAWGDYDNDGWLDLFVANRSGQNNFLYHNNRDGTFTRVTAGAIATDTGNSYGAAWADYDNDGNLDLFVTNFGGVNFLYRNNGDATFTRLTTWASNALTPGASVAASWGDFDNDGFLDLFVANGGPNNYLYHNNGASAAGATFTRLPNPFPTRELTPSSSATWSDVDGDGDADLFVPSYQGLSNALYENRSAGTNHWLKVRCIGALSNRAGIGARVRLKTAGTNGDLWQLRAISGGSGSSQDGLTAEFGLGEAKVVQTLEVRWLSGAVQTFFAVAADQSISVVEAPHVQTGAQPGSLQIAGGAGQRYQIEASTDLLNWTDLVTLTNTSGTVQFLDSAAATFPQRFYRASFVR